MGGVEAKANDLIFILSHAHEDHMKGLIIESKETKKTKSGWAYKTRHIDYDWNYGKLYCSVITHRLVLLKFPNLEKYMVPVPLGNEVIIDTI